MPRKPNNIVDKSLKVQQHHKLGSSAAEIMAKHVRGPNRLLPPGNPNATRQPRFEYSPSASYHEMVNKVADMKSRFNALPARQRTRFSNDPYQWLRFIENPDNRPEAVRQGLLPATDAEFLQMSKEYEDARLRALGKLPEPEPAAHLPDPEAQPDYGKKGSQKAKATPAKGGAEAE